MQQHYRSFCCRSACRIHTRSCAWHLVIIKHPCQWCAPTGAGASGADAAMEAGQQQQGTKQQQQQQQQEQQQPQVTSVVKHVLSQELLLYLDRVTHLLRGEHAVLCAAL